jgi:hypothetical protein
MDSRWWLDGNVIDVWFQLRDGMLIEGKTPTGARPPALRDAIYAYVLAQRTDAGTTPETIEAFVNGIELAAISSLRDAWSKRNK